MIYARQPTDSAMNALLNFVHERRTDSNECNIIGMGPNIGKYIVSEDDYDRFLELFHSNVFGNGKKTQNVYSLLEKHRDVGPPLVDLDLHYEKGGLLERRHQTETVRNFVNNITESTKLATGYI